MLQELASKAPELFAHNLYALGRFRWQPGVAAWVMSRRAAYCLQAPARAPARAARPNGRWPPPRSAPTSSCPRWPASFYYDLLQRFLLFPESRPRPPRARWKTPGSAPSHLFGEPSRRRWTRFLCWLPALPRLLLNATVVETGQVRRVAPSPTSRPTAIATRTRCSLNALPAMSSDDSVTRQQPLAGLVHHSARFPVVSPAGTVTRTPGRPDCAAGLPPVDGGYF